MNDFWTIDFSKKDRYTRILHKNILMVNFLLINSLCHQTEKSRKFYQKNWIDSYDIKVGGELIHYITKTFSLKKNVSKKHILSKTELRPFLELFIIVYTRIVCIVLSIEHWNRQSIRRFFPGSFWATNICASMY